MHSPLSPRMGLSSFPSSCPHSHLWEVPRHIPEVSNPMDVSMSHGGLQPNCSGGLQPYGPHVLTCSCGGPSLWMAPPSVPMGVPVPIPMDVSVPMEVPIHHPHGCSHPRSCEGPQRCPCPHPHGSPPWLSPFPMERSPFPIPVMSNGAGHQICGCSPLFHRDG